MKKIVYDEKNNYGLFNDNRDTSFTIFSLDTKWCLFIINNSGLNMGINIKSDYLYIVENGHLKINDECDVI